MQMSMASMQVLPSEPENVDLPPHSPPQAGPKALGEVLCWAVPSS